jgi:ABC-type lipoprotein export system ATPase subunit
MPELAAACRDLIQIYTSAAGPVPALRGISAEFPVASLTAVVGPSGSGKSTLLRLLACLERPTAGQLWIQGEPTAHVTGRARRRLTARRVGYVFQRPTDNLVDYLSAEDHVALAGHMRRQHLPQGAVSGVLVATGLEDLRRCRPHELSAGEQQRLAFAMGLVGDPTLVVADEPTAELDPDGAATIIELLPSLAAGERAFVIASHDPGLIAVADQVLVIRHGALTAEGFGDGSLLSVVDDADRVQLPDEARDLFPTKRVRTATDASGVRLERP